MERRSDRDQVVTHPLPPSITEDDEIMARLSNELPQWSRATSGVLRVFGPHRTRDGWVVLAPRAPAFTLQDVLEVTRHAEPVDQLGYACTEVLRLVRGLDGRVHREISPRSLAFASNGEVTLLPPLVHLCRRAPGIRMGAGVLRPHSLAWLSPELLRGEAVGAASDVYQLALLAYRALGAPPPFSGASEMALLDALMNETIPSLADVGITVPDSLDDVLSRALCPTAAARPSGDELASTLERFVGPAERLRAELVGRLGEAATAPREASWLGLFEEPVPAPCQKAWAELRATDRADIRHCDACDRPVEHVASPHAFALVVLRGGCVALDSRVRAEGGGSSPGVREGDRRRG